MQGEILEIDGKNYEEIEGGCPDCCFDPATCCGSCSATTAFQPLPDNCKQKNNPTKSAMVASIESAQEQIAKIIDKLYVDTAGCKVTFCDISYETQTDRAQVKLRAYL